MSNLIEDLQAAGHEDLASSLICVQGAVRKHWENVEFPDFTDHGFGHSERVAFYVDQLATVRNLPASERLSLHERYLLHAAAWLHDIGMNNPRADYKDPDCRVVANATEVRRTHAQRSEYMIRKREIDLGLPQNEILGPSIIGLLTLAHGTSSYKSSVARLATEARSFQGTPIRAERLAALLLMGDELDLNYLRVPNANRFRPLMNESSAHWLKHQCVERVSVEDAGEVHISIDFIPPADMSIMDESAIRKWVVNKLHEQIALTESEYNLGFSNSFWFSRIIHAKATGMSVRCR